MDTGILRLIAITSEPADDVQQVVQWAQAAVRGGATCIQLRAKQTGSGALLEIARALIAAVPVPLIVNDRADVALMAGAAGVHLGADDLPVERVRQMAPVPFIIGASVGCDEELALARGADYVGVGAVFGTGSKADAGTAIGVAEMSRLIRASGCPGVGIGGITAKNAQLVITSGASGVAALSALADDPERAARAIVSAIES